MKPGRLRWIALFLVLVAVMRLVYVGHLELAEDEAYYWVWSRHLAAGYFDHPPAIAFIIRAGTLLLGDTERGVRLCAAVLGVLTALAVAPMARDRWLAVAMLSTMPLFALGGLLATPDIPLMAAWALGLLAASQERWALVGLAAGLAMLSKYTGVLLLPLIVLSHPSALRTRGPWLAAGLALLVYMPNVIWNLQHDLVSWRFQLDHVSQAPSRLGFALAQLGLVGPILFPTFLVWWAVAWKGDRVDRLCWWCSAPLMLIAVAAGGEANWAAAAFIGPVVGIARRAGRWSRAAWVGTGVSGLLSLIAMVHALHPLVDLPDDPVDRLRGGSTLADSVRAWGIPDVYPSRYQEAALIEFYADIPARALPNEGRPDQYDLWPVQLADHALFVRPWRGNAIIPMLAMGYETPGPSTVTAYVNSTQPLVARPIGRWQVWEVIRQEPATESPTERPDNGL